MRGDLLAAAGADVIEWPHKTECCGASYSITNVEIVQKLSHDILAMARDAGADCIATACGMCQMNLDLRQEEIEQKYRELATPIWGAALTAKVFEDCMRLETIHDFRAYSSVFDL